MSADHRLGVLAIGHGTRNSHGLAEFQSIVERLAQRQPTWLVEPGLIELAEPTISQGFARLVERGARQVVALPLLLFAADHAREDIPRLLDEARQTLAPQRNGSLPEIAQAEVLGQHPQIIELSQRRYQAALAGLTTSPVAELNDLSTVRILVSRGSSDPVAIAAVQDFARRLDVKMSGDPKKPQLAVAFVAVARPSLAEVLEQAQLGSARRVVVQPHLLFTGQVLGQIQQAVDHCRAACPGKEWSIAAHLGADDCVVAALESRVVEACELFSA